MGGDATYDSVIFNIDGQSKLRLFDKKRSSVFYLRYDQPTSPAHSTRRTLRIFPSFSTAVVYASTRERVVRVNIDINLRHVGADAESFRNDVHSTSTLLTYCHSAVERHVASEALTVAQRSPARRQVKANW